MGNIAQEYLARQAASRMQPGAPVQPTAQPNFWDRTFGVPAAVGLLDPKTLQASRRSGLLGAGVALLANADKPFGQGLQAALQGGQQAYGQQIQAGQQAEQENARRAFAQRLMTVQSPDEFFPVLQDMWKTALANGDQQLATQASSILQTIGPALVRSQTPPKPTFSKDTVLLNDKGEKDPNGKPYVIQYDPSNPDKYTIIGPAKTQNEDYYNSLMNFRNSEMFNQLSRQYLSETNATYGQVARNYGTVIASARDPSAAGDLSLIFAYMKTLDPTSVVREGEFATAQNAGAVPERIWAQYNSVINGQRLSPNQRADFVDRARRLAEQKASELKPIMERYRRNAKRQGLVDPQDVVYDYFQSFDFSNPPLSKPKTDEEKKQDAIKALVGG